MGTRAARLAFAGRHDGSVYHGIASLRLYLIVAQDRREVTVHFRDATGTWQTRQAVGMDTIEIAVWTITSSASTLSTRTCCPTEPGRAWIAWTVDPAATGRRRCAPNGAPRLTTDTRGCPRRRSA
jgi:hypothetical protein